MSTSVHRYHHHRFSEVVRDRIGLWLFLLSESMHFLGLLASRFYLQGTARPEELSRQV